MSKNRRIIKPVSVFMAISFLSELLFPTTALALTGGPSQPEVQSFEPIGTNQMVDPFTGDFTYNIPLMDVGGYPVNISYHSGITMDQEASWVGLGWNINPGVINRNLRGLPDDFSGDRVQNEFNMKMNQTFGLSAEFGLEIFGGKPRLKGSTASFGLGVNYNTYNGVGVDLLGGVSPSIGLGKSGQESGTVGLGLSMVSNSNDGLTVNPSLSYSKKMDKKLKGEATLESLNSNIGVSINSRGGVSNMTFGISSSNSIDNFVKIKDKEGNVKTVNDKHMGRDALGSSINFVPNTYTPTQKMPFESGNYAASFKFGGELFGATGTFDLTGTYAYQKLKTKNQSTGGYGYIYSEYGYGKDTTLLDFNREKDRSFSRHTSNLPLTNFTYDLFGISGQGVSGMFRSHRSDVGYVHDPTVRNTSASFNLGLELGAGGIVKAGSDGKLNGTRSHSGLWRSNNAALPKLSFEGPTAADLYEPHYFKMVGERTADIQETESSGLVTRANYWKDAVKEDKPLRIDLSGSGYAVKAEPVYKDKNNSYGITNPTKRSQRAKRNQLVSYLTAREVGAGAGLNYRYSPYSQGHHIGEVTVLRTDGSRYVYGQPAYNFRQKEVSFNVSGNSNKDCEKGLIDYSATDASPGNKKGKDHFYQSTSTPAYAHSFLLSALLSADYSDFDQIKGPSDGDQGNYVKFDYEVLPSYKWRVPFQSYKANYNQGLESVASDDMGSYQYGEKEIHYVESIQSKTHIAIFTKSARKDGFGVAGEHGGIGGIPMKKLDKISLYALSDYREMGTNATPLKEVHFIYDYSQCPNVPNNEPGSVNVNGQDINANRGKLTLREVYFTYGNSYKAKFSSYEFNYGDTDHDGNEDENPSYNLKGYDRWGNYKPNNNNDCGIANPITAPEFPYVEQDKTLTDAYTASWNLTDIDLPSGGTIEIDYESDDYGYVQDKRAMQMFKILGSGSSASDFTPGSPSNSNILYENKVPKQYLFFKLQDAMSSTSTVSDLEDIYFGDILDQHLYFRFLVNLNDQWADGNFDYISGYAKIDQVGFVNNGGSPYEYAYIKVEKVKKGDKNSNPLDAHPISRAAWNFARIHNPELAYSTSGSHTSENPSETDVEDVFMELLDTFKNFGDFLKGANGALRSQDYGRKFHKGKSWVRLYNPNGKKLGGGVRVKKLVMKDNWAEMTSGSTTHSYGQEFEYELENGKSSGVAAYEPLAGGDENTFRQPVFFSEERLLAPDDEHYIEKPFGESFFPSPGVGYSRVTVKNLQYTNVTQHATGKMVHEFYTAKDFPTRTDQTDLEVKHKPADFLSKMLKFHVREHMNTSQGYVIETNDMHGKPKAQWIYAEGQKNYLSGVEHHYQTTTTFTPVPFSQASSTLPHRMVLNNEVPVLYPNNEVENAEIGVSYDLVNDFRTSYTKSESGGLCFNISTFLALIVPVAVPTLLPSYSSSINQYNSTVTTKVVNRFALQTGQTVYNGNSVIRTTNELWDAETGEVLLTKVENEYDDEVYNLSLPAHLAYEGMRGAYQNIGYQELVQLQTDGLFQDDASTSNFRKGDEVLIYYQYTPIIAWVLEKEHNLPGEGTVKKLHLVDKSGLPLTDVPEYNMPTSTQVFAKVIRSGYRNLMNQNIANVTMRKNPVQNGKLDMDMVTNYNPEVISASAMEYSELWQAMPPAVQEGGTASSAIFMHCDLLDDIDPTPDIEDAFGNLLVSLAQQNRLLTPAVVSPQAYHTTLLSDVEQQSGGTFSSQDQGLLESHFLKPISTPVYVTAWLEPTTGNYYLQNPDGTYRSVIRNITMLRLRFHNQSESIVNYADLEIDEVCSGGCPLSDKDYDESIIEVYPSILSYGIYNEQLTLNGSNALKLEEADGHFIYACPKGILPFKVRDCYWKVECPEGGQNPDGKTANPYVLGLRGNFRPKQSHAFLSERVYNSMPQIREDAAFNAFSSFWAEPSTYGDPWQVNTATYSSYWQEAASITRTDDFGNEVENQDPLGIYSSALYDFNGTLPTAVAHNAQYGQTAYESYENYRSLVFRCYPDHAYFGIHKQLDNDEVVIAENVAHTGRHSLEIPAANDPNYSNVIKYETPFNSKFSCPSPRPPDDVPYLYDADCDQNGPFGYYDDEGDDTDFRISFWLKEKNANRVFDFDNISITSRLYNNNSSPAILASLPMILVSKSEIIEGWQKHEYEFTIPPNYSSTTFDVVWQLFLTNNENIKYYLDDLRIQPVSSTMKSYAYHPQNFRLMGELDENNYATFYEYDEEGSLVRIKKETERGIKTIKENRNNIARN